jgi:hypothetical protein
MRWTQGFFDDIKVVEVSFEKLSYSSSRLQGYQRGIQDRFQVPLRWLKFSRGGPKWLKWLKWAQVRGLQVVEVFLKWLK